MFWVFAVISFQFTVNSTCTDWQTLPPPRKTMRFSDTYYIYPLLPPLKKSIFPSEIYTWHLANNVMNVICNYSSHGNFHICTPSYVFIIVDERRRPTSIEEGEKLQTYTFTIAPTLRSPTTIESSEFNVTRPVPLFLFEAQKKKNKTLNQIDVSVCSVRSFTSAYQHH